MLAGADSRPIEKLANIFFSASSALCCQKQLNPSIFSRRNQIFNELQNIRLSLLFNVPQNLDSAVKSTGRRLSGSRGLNPRIPSLDKCRERPEQ